jgi:hypothetical protein
MKIFASGYVCQLNIIFEYLTELSLFVPELHEYRQAVSCIQSEAASRKRLAGMAATRPLALWITAVEPAPDRKRLRGGADIMHP